MLIEIIHQITDYNFMFEIKKIYFTYLYRT